MKARLHDVSRTLEGRWRITFETVTDPREAVEDSEHDLEVTVKRFRQKRSLDANAYCWVLIDQLAAKLNLTKTDVYRNMIRNIGGVSTTVCVKSKAAERLAENWKRNGVGWFAELSDSKLEGCTNVTLFYGSSTYDTAQMSRLIDLVVQECKTLGIETWTPAELERLKEGWI